MHNSFFFVAIHTEKKHALMYSFFFGACVRPLTHLYLFILPTLSECINRKCIKAYIQNNNQHKMWPMEANEVKFKQ